MQKLLDLEGLLWKQWALSCWKFSFQKSVDHLEKTREEEEKLHPRACEFEIQAK